MKFIWQKLRLYLLPSIDINNEYYVIQNEETNFPLVITSFYMYKKYVNWFGVVHVEGCFIH